MEANTQEIPREINDSKNGVLCWFYVYKKNETGKSSICGIVIIKQLTDTVTDNESILSSLPENKIFFYTETTLQIGHDNHNYSYSYYNDELIKAFINMQPKNTDIDEFLKSYKGSITTFNGINKMIEKEKYKFIISYYSELSDFLKLLINKKFDIFGNT